MRHLPAQYSTARIVRDYFGLSQTALAGYLDVSRELLSAAETGRRELPTASLLRLAVLAQAVGTTAVPAAGAATPPAAPELLPVTLLPGLRPLLARHEACLLEADRLRHAAALLLRKAEQARRLHAVLPALAAALDPLPADERPRRWLTQLTADVAHLLSPAADAPRARLAAREAGLRAEAAWIRSYFENIAADDVLF
ncbi:hypothetical protein E5K00_15740 [Hymenobacter aquaticus]|uniref:HTH cro/C1-type domain-containing protein n=1 Tax=Hymenobacter aquaticus TaxID=1867101 RepID=A0A4Z0PXT5_9BACT|nr:hypothetical protein [Hymenobacter aquaticus]TGE21723.1 hypothetical protein E5K00_15740 [Hymenobacter aquaticus]